jgi:DNA helicase HerA-like ATPase
MGLMMVSQRPSELPDTSLAQCGTIVSLRLTNATDQSAVRSALPDSIAGLSNALPSLRTGEAIISGEACVLPSRVAIDRPFPEPKAGDPSLDSWLVDSPGPVDVKSVVAAWRGHELKKENDEND